MNVIKIFNFENETVRTKIVGEKEVFFCLRDVCRILEVKNVSDVSNRLDKSGVDSIDDIDSHGRLQKTTFINEPNLYRTIFQSKKPMATKFQDWVFQTVLPEIRKTGYYGSTNKVIHTDVSVYKNASFVAKNYKQIAKLYGCPNSLANALTAQEVKRVVGLDTTPLLVENKSDIQDRLVTPTELGKKSGVSAKEMNQILRKRGYQNEKRDHKNRISWELTEEGKKFGQYIDTGKKHSDGTPVQQVKWFEG